MYCGPEKSEKQLQMDMNVCIKILLYVCKGRALLYQVLNFTFN